MSLTSMVASSLAPSAQPLPLQPSTFEWSGSARWVENTKEREMGSTTLDIQVVNDSMITLVVAPSHIVCAVMCVCVCVCVCVCGTSTTQQLNESQELWVMHCLKR